MLTVLNIINYFIGRQLTPTIIISLSIAIYAYIILMYWEIILENYIYLWSLIILLILDIASIIVIYSSVVSNISISENNTLNSTIKNSLLENDTLKTCSLVDGTCVYENKKKKNKKNKKKKSKKIIPVYDGKTNTSIYTYNK